MAEKTKESAVINCSCRKPDRWVDDLGRVLCFNCMGRLDEECCEYEALRSSSEMRLIRLHPGQGQDALFCEILRVDLDQKPDYEAVSYFWGEPRFTEQIICQNSGILRVTLTCAAALRDLRYTTGKRSLWIDAICIDQESIHEKNHQVKLMQRIYTQARQVIVHLGSLSGTPSTAIQLLNHLSKKQPIPNTIDMMQAGMTDFISLPWFSRAWVLQELASARKATVAIGSHRFNWNMLSLHSISSFGLSPLNRNGLVPTILNLAPGTMTPFQDLGSLINAARNCSSSDPRDKVYALLGLFNDRSKLGISPDYMKAVETVYTEMTECIITATSQLEILSEVGREANSAQTLRDAFHSMDRILASRVNEKSKKFEVSMSIGKRLRQWFKLLAHTVSGQDGTYPLDDGELLKVSETVSNFQELDLENLFDDDSKVRASHRLPDIPCMLRLSRAIDGYDPGMWWRSNSNLDKFALWIKQAIDIQRESDPDIDEVLERGYQVPLLGGRRVKMMIRRAAPVDVEKTKVEAGGFPLGWNPSWMLPSSSFLPRKSTKDERQPWIVLPPILSKLFPGIEREETHGYAHLHPKSTSQHCTKIEDLIFVITDHEFYNPYDITESSRNFTHLDEITIECIEKVRRFNDNEMESAIFNYFEATKLSKMTGGARKSNNAGQHAQDFFQAGFFTSYDWLPADDPSFQRHQRFPHIDLPSWVPDLRKSTPMFSLDVWRPASHSTSGRVAEILHSGPSSTKMALSIQLLPVQRFSIQQDLREPCQPFPDVLNRANSDHDACIRTTSCDDFWNDLTQSLEASDSEFIAASVHEFRIGRKLGRTQRSFALCPLEAEAEDVICIIYGSAVPYVLRPKRQGDEREFQLIGECYLHGLRAPKALGDDSDYIKLLGSFADNFEAVSTDTLPWATGLLI